MNQMLAVYENVKRKLRLIFSMSDRTLFETNRSAREYTSMEDAIAHYAASTSEVFDFFLHEFVECVRQRNEELAAAANNPEQ